MNNRDNTSTFAAALLGAIIGTVSALTLNYLSKEENRDKLMETVDETKSKLSDAAQTAKTKITQTAYDSRNEISKNLRKLADQLENANT
jgi:gas vesicle protein